MEATKAAVLLCSIVILAGRGCYGRDEVKKVVVPPANRSSIEDKIEGRNVFSVNGGDQDLDGKNSLLFLTF